MKSKFQEAPVIVVKGAGEKASAVAYCLYEAGLTKIVMTDLPVPMAERRGVSFCEAIIDWRKEIQGVVAERAEGNMANIHNCWAEGKIPVVADPNTDVLRLLKPPIFIDALMAKRNRGTTMEDAPLVIALGPGFLAGKDCHVAVETNPSSSSLGCAIWKGYAEENTGVPSSTLGLTTERLLRSPADGRLVMLKEIGDAVVVNETIGHVGSSPLRAQISGCLWGIVRDGVVLKKGQKIGDIDPRGKKEHCFEIAPQARIIAEGVLLGISSFFNQ